MSKASTDHQPTLSNPTPSKPKLANPMQPAEQVEQDLVTAQDETQLQHSLQKMLSSRFLQPNSIDPVSYD